MTTRRGFLSALLALPVLGRLWPWAKPNTSTIVIADMDDINRLMTLNPIEGPWVEPSPVSAASAVMLLIEEHERNYIMRRTRRLLTSPHHKP